MQIKVKKLHTSAHLPIKATEHANGYDLTCTDAGTDLYGNYVVHTDIAVEIPVGFVGLLFPRSSISKTDCRLANSVGVIDSDYRGEVVFKFRGQTTATNWREAPYKANERCGQLLIVKAEIIDFVEADELSETVRGTGGFGSTGA